MAYCAVLRSCYPRTKWRNLLTIGVKEKSYNIYFDLTYQSPWTEPRGGQLKTKTSVWPPLSELKSGLGLLPRASAKELRAGAEKCVGKKMSEHSQVLVSQALVLQSLVIWVSPLLQWLTFSYRFLQFLQSSSFPLGRFERGEEELSWSNPGWIHPFLVEFKCHFLQESFSIPQAENLVAIAQESWKRAESYLFIFKCTEVLHRHTSEISRFSSRPS